MRKGGLQGPRSHKLSRDASSCRQHGGEARTERTERAEVSGEGARKAGGLVSVEGGEGGAGQAGRQAGEHEQAGGMPQRERAAGQ